MTTIDDAERAERRARQRELADRLKASGALDGIFEQIDAGEVPLGGDDGLLKGMLKAALERGLEVELTDHVGYERGDPEASLFPNSRNGTTPKMVASEIGDVELAVPRDRNGTFTPQLVPKGARRLGGLDEMIISLYAGGMTLRDIQHHLVSTIGTELSHETISKITDQVAEEVLIWQRRPLDARRFLANVANHCDLRGRVHRCMACCGVRSPRQRRGRSFSSAAMLSSCSALQAVRSVPFGRYCRSRPFVFSLVGRCQGECGSAK
jgi:hypothetical protein